MRVRNLLALGLSVGGLFSVTAVLAQKEEAAAAPARKLDTDVFALRLMLGVGDTETKTWSGNVTIDQGEVVSVEGHRFRKGDRVAGRDRWEAQSRPIRKAVAKKAAAKAAQNPAQKANGPSTFGPLVTPNGVLLTLKAPSDAVLSVTTEHGRFTVPLTDLAAGEPKRYLDGKVEAQRIPAGIPLVDTDEQEDFPAAAADRQGGTWVAYVAHEPRGQAVLESFRERPKDFAAFAPKGGGDQIRLLRFANGQASAAINVTEREADVWRPAVAVAGDGSVVVAWSENKGGNWDLYSRRYDPAAKSWSETKRLTSDAGTDTDVALATAPDGKVWMTWQAWRSGQADILAATVDGEAQPISVAGSSANEWSPAIAVDRNGGVHVVFDTYEKGNYDVRAWSWDDRAKKGVVVAVADSPRYEARPTLAVDSELGVWVAYEERDANWGKDAENLLEGKGSTLYRSATVRVRRVVGDRVFEAANPLAKATGSLRTMNSYPRIAIDRDGRVWLAFRNRLEAIWGNNSVMVVGGVWLEYATVLTGQTWTPPQFLPRSDGSLDHRAALVAPSDGPMLAFYSTDGRLRREIEFTPELMLRYWAHSGTPGSPQGTFNEDLQVAALAPASTTGPIKPEALQSVAEASTAPPVHADETGDLARIRNHRIEAGGKRYQLLRGDFHRHTEISQDGGSDGSYEDMWRYAIDAAQLDWMGYGDHDNGGGKEYTWWLSQKTTDLYHTPSFPTMFTYERSVPYPHGHRNVMFPRRGVRTLPRLVDATGVVDADTAMLYDYLKEHGGLCASHTSATGMGTDWRDVNPQFEPIVEIFQGHRNSYEHFGAPRVARRPGESIGGWKPLGMVWNALGMQYRLGFQASSDHISTHISYAVAIAENASREAVFDAFQRRHCYGATDNIVLDVRSGEHIMGDEFAADGPVSLKVLVHGTRPIARVDIIKDFVHVYSTEPKRARVEFEWKDEEKRAPGLSWYYVRAVQEDGEIAWGSPFWVRHPNAQAAQ